MCFGLQGSGLSGGLLVPCLSLGVLTWEEGQMGIPLWRPAQVRLAMCACRCLYKGPSAEHMHREPCGGQSGLTQTLLNTRRG